MGSITLDCKACSNEKTMSATEINKFTPAVVVIGWIIATPSIFGVFVAAFMLVVSLGGGSETAISVRIGISIALGIFSLVGGLLGYLLIMKKKVFKCKICGFVMDRA